MQEKSPNSVPAENSDPEEPKDYYLDKNGIYRTRWQKETWFTRLCLIPMLFLLGGVGGMLTVSLVAYKYLLISPAFNILLGPAFVIGGLLAISKYLFDMTRKIFRIQPRKDKTIVYKGSKDEFERWRKSKTD
jgi:hypothetical protein